MIESQSNMTQSNLNWHHFFQSKFWLFKQQKKPSLYYESDSQDAGSYGIKSKTTTLVILGFIKRSWPHRQLDLMILTIKT